MVLNYEADIAPIKEDLPFQEEGARSYLLYWCSVNDHLNPNFISREEWEEKVSSGKVLEPEEDGFLIVNIPIDVQMWEIFDFVRAIDEDTFQDNREAGQEREKLKELITTYRYTGIYLKTYIEGIDWGEDYDSQDMAIDLTTDFYRFSRWVQRRGRGEVNFEDVPVADLEDGEQRQEMEEEMRRVEELLLGTKLVQKRYDRLEKRLGGTPTLEEIDQERRWIIRAFFKAMTRAYHVELDFDQSVPAEKRALQDRSWKEYADKYLGKSDELFDDEELAERERLIEDFSVVHPGQHSGPSFGFQQATYHGLERFFSRPKRELEKSIHRRGKVKLIESLNEAERKPSVFNLLKKVGVDFSGERQRLADKVEVQRLKEELASLKESGASVEQVSTKELAIVSIIQAEISKYEYEEDISLPITIRGSENINCVGASLISSILFDEVGIKHLEAGVRGHSIVVVVTADQRVHYRDMRYDYLNKELSDEDLGEGQLAMLQSYAQNPQPESLSLDVDLDWYQTILFGKGLNSPTMNFYHPSQGFSHGIMNNLTMSLEKDVENNFDSLETLTTVMMTHLDQFPTDVFVLRMVIETLTKVGDFDRATLLLYKMENVKGGEELPYLRHFLWGKLFFKQEKYELALESLRNAVIYYSSDKDIWEMMVSCLENLEREGSLEATLKEAIKFTDGFRFKTKLIALYIDREDIESALDIYEEFINQYPDDLHLWSSYYELLFIEDPSYDNCREALIMMERLGQRDDMDLMIEKAREENVEDIWPDELADEFEIAA
jgi:tetratricopeptide (TPR) repeat protein